MPATLPPTLPMRTLLYSAVLGLAAVPASAQSFRLAEPTLSVDGRRVGVVGAPLVQESFGALTLNVPGSGTYRVSDRPFDGARGVGQFDGAGLYFAVDGRSVRLSSDGPILDRPGPATAFVRFDASPEPGARGLARVAVTGPGRPADARGSGADRTEAPPSGQPPRGRPRVETGGAEQLRADLDRVSSERRALESDRDRLRVERDAALAERDRMEPARDRSEAARTRLAAELAAAVRRAETAATPAAAARTQAETARLRDEIVARDRALDALRTESEDRRVRLAETDAALGTSLRALAAARAAAPALSAPTPASTPPSALPAAVRPAESPDADTERARLAERLAAAERERDALALQVAVLQQERDGLRDRIDRLTADLGAVRLDVDRLRQAPPVRLDETPPPAPTTDAQTADDSRARAYFPGFDFARLQNPDVVRRRLDEAEFPHWAAAGRISGDVLVLFATDRDGRVIRTAVSSPIGGGLDGFAESLVRDMRFVPPTVGGVPTGLRSQVLVRFEP